MEQVAESICLAIECGGAEQAGLLHLPHRPQQEREHRAHQVGIPEPLSHPFKNQGRIIPRVRNSVGNCNLLIRSAIINDSETYFLLLYCVIQFGDECAINADMLYIPVHQGNTNTLENNLYVT